MTQETYFESVYYIELFRNAARVGKLIFLLENLITIFYQNDEILTKIELSLSDIRSEKNAARSLALLALALESEKITNKSKTNQPLLH